MKISHQRFGVFYLVDSLTPSAHKQTEITSPSFLHGLQFRWDFILIYVGLRFLQGGGFGWF